MERIILGSADVYIQAFDGSTVPVTADICKPENLMAYISGGASVEYKPSFYTAKDDTGKKSKTIVTEEEVTLKTGIMTFDGNKFKYLCDTARVTEDKAKKRRTVKIGGIDNRQGARYVICLHHKDAVDGDIWVMIVGNNQAGFTYCNEAAAGAKVTAGGVTATIQSVEHIDGEPDGSGKAEKEKTKITLSRTIAAGSEAIKITNTPSVYDTLGMTEEELEAIKADLQQ